MRYAFGQTVSPQDQLSKVAPESRERTKTTPAGKSREELRRIAGQADAAARIDEWVNSPGLRPPT